MLRVRVSMLTEAGVKLSARSHLPFVQVISSCSLRHVYSRAKELALIIASARQVQAMRLTPCTPERQGGSSTLGYSGTGPNRKGEARRRAFRIETPAGGIAKAAHAPR